MVGFTGVTSMDTREAEVTMRMAVPEMLLRVARMVVWPTPTPELSPSVTAELEMVATAGFEEDHRTLVVRSWVELSL